MIRQRRVKGVILTPLKACYVPKLSIFLLSKGFACSVFCSKFGQNKVIIFFWYCGQWINRSAFVSGSNSLCLSLFENLKIDWESRTSWGCHHSGQFVSCWWALGWVTWGDLRPLRGWEVFDGANGLKQAAPHTAQVQENDTVGGVSKTIFCRSGTKRRKASFAEISRFQGQTMYVFTKFQSVEQSPVWIYITSALNLSLEHYTHLCEKKSLYKLSLKEDNLLHFSYNGKLWW